MTIIYFLLLLTIIICLHELGHLVAAKLFHVYCFEYSFGMGPVLLQKQFGETKYSLRALPIGGFVSMAGEIDGDEAYPDVKVPSGRRLTEVSVWKKIVIMLAGVIMNFLLAWFLCSMIVLRYGVYIDSPKAVINTVLENSPAQRSGFLPGDEIVKIISSDGDGINPETFMDMQSFLLEHPGEELEYEVMREGVPVTLQVQPEIHPETQLYYIGVSAPNPPAHQVHFFNAWYYGGKQLFTIGKMMVNVLGKLFRGIGLQNLSGPVGIYTATKQTSELGLTSYFFLMAQLSLNIGIINLLPLPVLDGGQVVITLFEALLRKKLNDKIKIAIMGACWVVLIALMVFVTWNDIARLLNI